MKIKKIGIIILALVLTGGIAGVVGYRINLQDKKQQKLEVQKATEVKAKNDQTEVSSKNEQVEVKSNNNKQVEVKSKSEQAKFKTKNEQVKVKQGKIENKQPKKEKLTHSDFESKIQPYIAEFRVSGGDISNFKQNLDSINIKALNTEDKEYLDNLKLAAEDWTILTEGYSYLKESDEPYSEDRLKCAKDLLAKVNTKNLLTTRVMRKTDLDKYISYLKEYEDFAQSAVDRERKLREKHSKLKTKKEKQEFYYKMINDAMQREIKYIDSIKDPNVKGMVQSPMGAAVGMETSLEMLFPEDTEVLRETLSSLTH